jgi:chemotaxis response regulator CheB
MSKKSAPGVKRILIVDDHPMMRQGLSQLIGVEPDLAVCGEAEEAGAALDAIGKLKPDLVLADISLPGKNGLELIKDFQSMQPRRIALRRTRPARGRTGLHYETRRWKKINAGHSAGVGRKNLRQRKNVRRHPGDVFGSPRGRGKFAVGKIDRP